MFLLCFLSPCLLVCLLLGYIEIVTNDGGLSRATARSQLLTFLFDRDLVLDGLTMRRTLHILNIEEWTNSWLNCGEKFSSYILDAGFQLLY